ncbi:MAG TPA: ribosome silencing factor [Pirellulaceae bacterium]|nr:ribosome silencing factor [Pirellulaceae bacterium]HMO93586.1 ribosome silencing factor [Pirellulaceae bacterium]HMP70510.1 ribosome silencing factor [Pirellulaceae bacterium]
MENSEPLEMADDDSSLDDEGFSGSVDRVNPERSLLLAKTAASTAAELGGENILVLDMTERTALFDYFVIITGSSRRHLQAMADEIDQVLEVQLNDKRLSIDGTDNSRWIVLDYGSVVIHLFDEDTRAFYSLEALWSDAPKVNFSA